MKQFLIITVLLSSLFAISSQSRADNLRVAVASNFAPTLQLVKQQFEIVFPHKITIVKGSTGKLYAQIKHGAPYDVFLAADVNRPELLEKSNLIVPQTRYTYAIGQLVLWSNQYTDNLLDVLKAGKFKKLAIANPKIAPYGKAAIEVMQWLAVYHQNKTKLVYGENVAQALQFIQSGSAQLGFVALSLVKNAASHYWQPPQDTYQRLEQQLVVLKSSKQQALARQFVEFLKRSEIRALIEAQGYLTL